MSIKLQKTRSECSNAQSRDSAEFETNIRLQLGAQALLEDARLGRLRTQRLVWLSRFNREPVSSSTASSPPKVVFVRSREKSARVFEKILSNPQNFLGDLVPLGYDSEFVHGRKSQPYASWKSDQQFLPGKVLPANPYSHGPFVRYIQLAARFTFGIYHISQLFRRNYAIFCAKAPTTTVSS